MDGDFKKAVEFHGHTCTGLAIGYRVARYIEGNYPRSKDEELVCIVENKSCSVDAIQAILGCTFGKGNLVFIDNGKQVFKFYSRDNGTALRVYFKSDVFKRMDELRQKAASGKLSPKEKKELEGMREQMIQKVLSAPVEELLSVKESDIPAPDKARIYPSLRCQECRESFMEIKGRTADGKVVCKDCFERLVC